MGRSTQPSIDSLIEHLPPGPLTREELTAVKRDVHTDCSPLLGLRPEPTDEILVLMATFVETETGYVLSWLDDGWDSGQEIPLAEWGQEQMMIAYQASLQHAVETIQDAYPDRTHAVLM